MQDELRTPAGDGEEIALPPLATIEQALNAQEADPPAAEAAVEAEQESVPAPVPVPETPAAGEAAPAPASEVGPEARAAQLLAEQYRGLPEVVPSLIQGGTVEAVNASLEASRKAYGDVRTAVLREQGEAVPSARSGAGPAPTPATPGGMIEAGLAAHDARARK